MSGAEIVKLIVVLAPIAKEFVIEGSKIVATLRENIAQEDLNKALELSKSAGWPELTFEATKP